MPKRKVQYAKRSVFWPCGDCRMNCSSDSIECSNCKSWFHYDCQNLSASDVNSLGGSVPFTCFTCLREEIGPSYSFPAALLRLMTMAVTYGYSALMCAAKREAVVMPTDTLPEPTDPGNTSEPTDRRSAHYLKRYGMEKSGVPLKVKADGNCLFNALSLSLFGHQSYATQIRVRTCIQMCLNADMYTNHRQASDIGLLSPSYVDACKDCSKDGEYSSVWTMMAAADVLGVTIKSVYPPVNGIHDLAYKTLNNVFNPRSIWPKATATIMWTNTEYHQSGIWTPNHFVTLITEPSATLEQHQQNVFNQTYTVQSPPSPPRSSPIVISPTSDHASLMESPAKTSTASSAFCFDSDLSTPPVSPSCTRFTPTFFYSDEDSPPASPAECRPTSKVFFADPCSSSAPPPPSLKVLQPLVAYSDSDSDPCLFPTSPVSFCDQPFTSSRIIPDSDSDVCPVKRRHRVKPLEEHSDDNSFDISNRSYEIPEQPLEESISDSSIEDPMEGIDPNAPTTYTIVDQGSKRGRSKLFSTDGYSFTVKRQSQEKTWWWCSVRGKVNRCPATVTQVGNTFLPGRLQHNHPSVPGSAVSSAITAEVKKKASMPTHAFTRSSEIVKSVLKNSSHIDLPEPSRPSINNLKRQCNRRRQKDRPPEPRDLQFDLATYYISPDFLRADIQQDGQRHIIFATEDQLRLLSKAKCWYMDGTFKIVKPPFKQLFSINCFLTSGPDMKQVPLMFAIMSRRRKRDYIAVLRALLGMLPRTSVKQFVADFESGLWLALKKLFPRLPVRGCVFHWSQAIFRKIQRSGLVVAYNSKGGVYKFLRKIMVLPFLPAEHIPVAFMNLKETAPDGLKVIIRYVEKRWVQSNLWPIESWCVFMRSIRTNNDVEGWHNDLNTQACIGNPPFYLLCRLLHEETSLLPLQVKLVSEGKLKRYQRRRTRHIQGKIFSLWSQYTQNQLTCSTLLRRCAFVYGPTPDQTK